MGSWCVVCAISGIPIHPGDEVVGFLLAVSPFGPLTSSYPFIPVSIPAVGTYDDYGGVEVEGGESFSGDGMIAICHRKMWDAAVKLYGDKGFAMSPYPKLTETWANVNAEIKKETASYEALIAANPNNDTAFWRKRADPFECAHSKFSSRNEMDFLRFLGAFTLGVPGKVDDKGMPYEQRALIPERDLCGPFETLILEGLINGLPEKSIQMLEELCKVYVTTIWRCRPILPEQMVRCEQYPDYKKENSWVNTVHKFSEAVVKKKKAADAKSERDMKKWLAKSKKEEKKKKKA